MTSIRRGREPRRFILDLPMQLTSDIVRPRLAVAADGVVEGYASLFGVVDQANDMVVPGAFAASLRRRGMRRIPMLFQHDPAEPIGLWDLLTEDWRGLYVRGRLIPEVARARELIALIAAGTADGLSIGFRTVKARVDARTRVRRLLEVDLWEISLVTFPMLNGARLATVDGKRLPYRISLARVEAPEHAAQRTPRTSPARAQAERAWRAVIGRQAC